MSGEAVGSPLGLFALPAAAVAIGAGAVIGAAVVPGSLAARAIKALIDRRVEVARLEIVAERERVAAWATYAANQQLQQEQQAEMFRAFARAADTLALLELREPTAGPVDRGATGRAFTGADALTTHAARGRDERTPRLLKEIAATLDQFATDLAPWPDSPHPRLVSYKNQLLERTRDGSAITFEEVETFQKMIVSTLRDYHESQKRIARKRTESAARVQSLLDDALAQLRLAVTPAQHADVAALIQKLGSAMDPKAPPAGRLDFIERQLSGFKSDIGRSIEHESARTALVEAIERHLSELDYEIIERFAGTTGSESSLCARMRVPGGEQVKITLNPNGRIAFQLSHETAIGEIAGHFLSHFRAQEQRWCADLQELFRRLVAEGFSYGVTFERAVPEQSVQLVKIDTADEWLAPPERKKRGTQKSTRRTAR